MQQIYRQGDQEFEVFTTVFSPQVCRARTRTRTRHVETEVLVVKQHRSRWQRELDLDPGDLIQVLVQEDEAWWFGRLANGHEGYFPAACVQTLQERRSCSAFTGPHAAGCNPSRATPTLARRGSVPVTVTTAGAPCGCTSGRSTPKLLRKNSILRPLGLDGPPAVAPPPRSPSLLRRVLAKSRRKSCPHLPHPPHPEHGSANTAFLPD
ncbi:jouberin isoform X2 [Sander lucioperca]|uniref:jouberin isoform X2 n=1 Tax=Sander lucioperca TaxID=283035 RepID=UPI00125D58B9|nr:jouberin isoform X2 [Sander lucioperca]